VNRGIRESRLRYLDKRFSREWRALFKHGAHEEFAQPSAVSSARLIGRQGTISVRNPFVLNAGVAFTFMAAFRRAILVDFESARWRRSRISAEGRYRLVGELLAMLAVIGLFILAIITSARDKIATVSITLPAMRSYFIRVGKIGLSTCAYQSRTCVFVDLLRKYQTENII